LSSIERMVCEMAQLIGWFQRHTTNDDRITRAKKIVVLFVALFSGIGLLVNYLLFISSYDDVTPLDHVVLLLVPFAVVLSAPKYCVETRNITFAANLVFAASYAVIVINTLHAGSVVGTVTYFMMALAVCYSLMFGWRGFAIAAVVSLLHFLVFAALGDLLQFDFTLAQRHGHAATARNLVGQAKNYILVFLTASSCAAAFHQQMTRAVGELAEARKAAEAASRAKSEFLASMSHEIRTPMNGLIGMLEVLVRTEADETRRAHASTALKSSTDLMFLLDDIVDISKVESRRLSLDREPFCIAAAVDDVATLFGSLAREKSLALSAEVAASVPEWVEGDRRRLRQVLTNLVGNAVKFTDAGKVAVSVRYDADLQVACFSVSDTGSGIAPDVVDKVFDQFFQANSSTTREHGGSGLGLAISRQLVSMMGGVIQVDSKLGEGSTFHFTIAAPVALPPSPERVESLASPSKNLRVLVAEDNPAMQQILGALLEAGQHQATVVSNGRDAVALAASQTFDVILMDVMMPMMDGPTAAQRIRELGGRAGGIPIIALTANALVGDRDRYLAAGMTDYLSKPIDVAALFAALDRVTVGG
jgi:signal transduction histidine kinase/ActR/RegA family two-component response regulator